MSPGDQVRITGPRGSVLGTIKRMGAPQDLPQIPGAPDAAVTAEILESLGVDQVAMLSYESEADGTLVFAAVRSRGQWTDLQGQWLEIEPAQAN